MKHPYRLKRGKPVDDADSDDSGFWKEASAPERHQRKKRKRTMKTEKSIPGQPSWNGRPSRPDSQDFKKRKLNLEYRLSSEPSDSSESAQNIMETFIRELAKTINRSQSISTHNP